MEMTCRGKKFLVYTVAEAMKKGINALFDWRKAEKGDWVVTGDGKVMEIIGRRKKHPKTNKKPFYLLRSGFGEHPTYKKNIYASKQIDYDDRSYHGKKLLTNVKPTALQNAFVDKLCMNHEVDRNGQFSSEDIISAYMGTFMENNPTQALRRGMNLVKRKYIRERISMNLREKFIEQGMDDEWVVSQYKELIDGTSQSNTKLNAINRVSDLLGHAVKEKETSSQSIIMISDGDKKLLAEVRKKLSDRELNQLMSKVKSNGVKSVIEDKSPEV